MACVDVRRNLLHQLKGQGLHVPDLRLLFQHWPSNVNPNLEELRALAPGRIDDLTTCSKKRKAAGKIDVALFTSSWYPGAGLQCGDMISCVVLWLFLWDDDRHRGRAPGRRHGGRQAVPPGNHRIRPSLPRSLGRRRETARRPGQRDHRLLQNHRRRGVRGLRPW
ncbi:hypothetical protein CTA2_2770 [Colletotrichum tanaceti]|nr:hypothetical protein CTA2_2770 [Colletotrichum tanaceti]